RGQGAACWVDPGAGDATGPEEHSERVQLQALLEAASEVARALRRDCATWTDHDMTELAACGGDSLADPSMFAAQFRARGSASRYPRGHMASSMYVVGVLVTSALWVSSEEGPLRNRRLSTLVQICATRRIAS
ncbi:unnamed protein product, partial [Prorocentrum cordatum]